MEKRINNRMDKELRTTIGLFEDKVKLIQESVDEQLRLMQRMRAKDKSDNDRLHASHDKRLISQQEQLDDHS